MKPVPPAIRRGASALTPALGRRLQEALAQAASGDRVAARAALEALHRSAPHAAPVRNALGVLRLETGDVDGALRLLEPLAARETTRAALQVNVGNALVAAGRFDDAIAAFTRAVNVEAEVAANWYGLARALQLAGRPGEAIAPYGVALHLAPGDVEAWSNLSAALAFLDRHAEAERAAAQAITRAPSHAGAHFNRAMALLSLGRWAEGWEAFEWRLRTGLLRDLPPSPPTPVWDGTPLAGRTLLVRAEQGFGDSLLYARFVPRLQALGGRVVFAVQRPLVRLCAVSALADAVVPLDATPPAHDVHVSLSSLPHRLRCHDVGALAGPGRPYLRAPDGAPGAACDTEARARRIGIAWGGHPRQLNDGHRSCGLAALRPLFDVPGITLVSLQVGPRADEPQRLGLADRVACELAAGADFADTATLMTTLDHVVTVDTAVAHLAGALGIPVTTLLPRIGLDWRWTGVPRTEDGRTPWYASMRCLRQREPGRWDDVVAHVARRLATVATR